VTCNWAQEKKLSGTSIRNNKLAGNDLEMKAKLEREYQLKKLLAGKSEEQQKIKLAQ
jgi:hypothetical protein